MEQSTQQEALDKQYNLRARHPDFEQFFEKWEKQSAQVRSETLCHLDIPFGDSAMETLDIFPAGKSGAPVVLFIHGGYWQFLDKHFFSFVAPPLVAAGCTVAVNNYALAPSVPFPEIVRQNQAAVAWLFKNISDFNGDPNQLTVCGHSAGGHLTASMVTTDWEADYGLPKDLIKAGCAISGLFDLAPVRDSFLNEVLGLDDTMVSTYSPILHHPAVSTPMEILVGAAETDGFREHSANFARHWQGLGHPTAHSELTGLNHFSIMDEMATAEGQLTQAVLRMVSG